MLVKYKCLEIIDAKLLLVKERQEICPPTLMMLSLSRNGSSFDLGGNRTHDLRIRSTVALPTELRGHTEKVGDDLGW